MLEEQLVRTGQLRLDKNRAKEKIIENIYKKAREINEERFRNENFQSIKVNNKKAIVNNIEHLVKYENHPIISDAKLYWIEKSRGEESGSTLANQLKRFYGIVTEDPLGFRFPPQDMDREDPKKIGIYPKELVEIIGEFGNTKFDSKLLNYKQVRESYSKADKIHEMSFRETVALGALPPSILVAAEAVSYNIGGGIGGLVTGAAGGLLLFTGSLILGGMVVGIGKLIFDEVIGNKVLTKRLRYLSNSGGCDEFFRLYKCAKKADDFLQAVYTDHINSAYIHEMARDMEEE